MSTQKWRDAHREEQKEYKRRHYLKHKKQVKKEVAARKRILQEKLVAYKKGLKCQYCAENYIRCLEFHHTNPKKKDNNIATAVAHGWGWDRILCEIQKCVVVCANCHRKLHDGIL